MTILGRLPHHERWRALRDAAGFERLAIMGAALPAIRSVVEAQLRRRTLDRTRVLAGMVRLLDLSGIRAGNEVYRRENAPIGLATLRRRHVCVDGATIVLRFPAKSGMRSEISVTDRALARLLEQMKAGSRQRVFRSDGAPMSADDLNAFLEESAAAHTTAKDFRTWRGTVTALAFLAGVPSERRGTRASGIAAIDAAATALGNTRAVARAHYVHPGLARACRNGALDSLQGSPDIAGLHAEERILMALLPRLAAPSGHEGD